MAVVYAFFSRWTGRSGMSGDGGRADPRGCEGKTGFDYG